jgi:hypothetical protein
MVDGKPVSLNGDSYTTKQPVVDFRTFLRDGTSCTLFLSFSTVVLTPVLIGKCGQEGENCPYIEGALENQLSHAAIFVLPYVHISPGHKLFSLTSISLHSRNATDFHPLSYTFQNGGNCNGKAQDCNFAKCPEAVHIGLPPIILPPVMYPGKNCTGDNVSRSTQALLCPFIPSVFLG